MRKQLNWRKLLLLGFFVLFAVSAVQVTRLLIEAENEQQVFLDLAQRYGAQQNQENGDSAENGEDGSNTAPSIDCQSLKEENPDFFGWLSIAGTEINYPVMHTPADPQYYLRRAFDGSYSHSGVPFLAGECFEGCGNYLIYGHNMNNGTMFAELLSYAKEEFWQEHSLINFVTLSGSGSYEVIAAFYGKAYSEGEEGFRYYQYTDLSDEKTFNEYLEQVSRVSLYGADIEAVYGDTLLTLSTCSYHTDNGRFAVVAKKIDSTEQKILQNEGD